MLIEGLYAGIYFILAWPSRLEFFKTGDASCLCFEVSRNGGIGSASITPRFRLES